MAKRNTRKPPVPVPAKGKTKETQAVKEGQARTRAKPRTRPTQVIERRIRAADKEPLNMASKTTTPGHAHPHEAVPVRIARESGFAGPGLDVPAEKRRPARDAGTNQDHPLNRPVDDEDKSLIGPELGKGGIDQPMQVHAIPDPPPHEVDEGFHDASALIMKPRGS
jgi:hypothetical protein